MSEPFPPESGAKPPRTSGRGIKIALALSLAFNLLIVGLVAGAMLGGDRAPGGSAGAPGLRTLGLGPFALALSRDDRAVMRERFGDLDFRGDRRAIGGALRDIQAALRADPFDRTGAEAAFARSRRAAEGLQAQGHGALLDHLETMSAPDRVALADRLSRALRRVAPTPNR
jgi:uncharacterized membrane protein